MAENTENVQKYEELFAHRFTSEDPEYQQYQSRPEEPPPIVEDWNSRRGIRIVVDVGVLAGVETEVGTETGIGERIIMDSNSGMTDPGRHWGMEVTFTLVRQTPIRDTIPTIRDTIITTIDV
ncbi:hypothetical protein D4764_02G0008910 [Takifugu flavidus]|uniref:Uncharacterized protein n=1 Tax=Takifugu flavidus TaxID=433684 RepID=A0A5C6NNV8_9TELE|nr:hypothetical protein D4764_02G0008910 [Takifugu flavidus]